jgi:hypothetical protein
MWRLYRRVPTPCADAVTYQDDADKLALAAKRFGEVYLEALKPIISAEQAWITAVCKAFNPPRRRRWQFWRR